MRPSGSAAPPRPGARAGRAASRGAGRSARSRRRCSRGDEPAAEEHARWALDAGAERSESPIGRYAATLALLVLARWADARHVADSLRERDDFPHDVADALAYISAHDVVGYAEAIESVVESFETRTEYLEDARVADTALVLDLLARRRGIDLRVDCCRVADARPSGCRLA